MPTSSERAGAGTAPGPSRPGERATGGEGRAGLKLGVLVDGPPQFVQLLLADWRERYDVRVFSHADVHLRFFESRVNRWRLHHALTRFFAASDVVFIEWAGPLLVEATRLAPSVPIVVRLHSFELFAYAPRVTWSAVSRIVLVSEAMRRRFCAMFPDQAGKTCVVYNGVDLAAFGAPRARFSTVVGMLCNLLPIKRVYEAILTIGELARSGLPVSLHVAGPSKPDFEGQRYRAALERLVADLALGDRIALVGPSADAPRFLAGVDLFLSNSYWEGQQVALLEAMAAGCCCLAHRWEGAEEVLPPEDLFRTDGELQEQVRRFVAMDEGARRARSDAMRALARARFGSEDAQAGIRAVIEGAFRARRASGLASRQGHGSAFHPTAGAGSARATGGQRRDQTESGVRG